MDDAAARLNLALEDRYEILEGIGQGGMALVFLAEDLKHRRKVANDSYPSVGDTTH